MSTALPCALLVMEIGYMGRKWAMTDTPSTAFPYYMQGIMRAGPYDGLEATKFLASLYSCLYNMP